MSLIIGVAWYRSDQYPLLRALASDSDSMAPTYDQWRAGVGKLMEDLRKQGLEPRRVDVDVKDLMAWCEERGRLLDGPARSNYASEKVRTQ